MANNTTADEDKNEPASIELERIHDDLNDEARRVLDPAVNQLVTSSLTSHSLTNSLLQYYKEAITFGTLAQQNIEEADQLDLPEPDKTLLTSAIEAAWNAARFAQGDKPTEARQSMGRNLDTLVNAYTGIENAVELATGGIEGSLSDVHPDDSRWEKHTDDTLAGVELPILGRFELDAMCSDPEGIVQIFDIHQDTVPISVEFRGERDGHEISAQATASLTPDQTEALADSLMEAAEAARENAETTDGAEVENESSGQ